MYINEIKISSKFKKIVVFLFSLLFSLGLTTVAFSQTYTYDIIWNGDGEDTGKTATGQVVFNTLSPSCSNRSTCSHIDSVDISVDGQIFTASETISTPVVTFNSGSEAITDTSVTYTNTSGNTWTAAYTANASDTSGAVSYSIAFSDTAGNAGTAVTSGSGSVTFDTTAPTLSSVSIASNNSTTTLAKADDVVTLTFTASETISTPVVTFNSGSEAITDTSVTYTNTSGNTWTAAYTANASDTSGAVSYSIAFSDTAGNAGTAVTSGSGSVTFDTTAPTMAITAAEISDGGTSNDATLSLTFTSSEATSNFVVGDITISGGALSNFATSSSTVFTATFTPTASGATTIDVAAGAFTDAVGNNNSAASQFNWTYDGTAPTLSSVSIVTNNAITSVANDGDVVTLTLTASEAISTPTVTFKSGGAAITDTSVTYTNTNGNIWTAAYTANASDTIGAVTFSIAYNDTVGNAGTAVTTTTNSTSVSFMPTPSAAFAAVKADVESKMAANARTQLNDFATSTSSIVGSARSRFMNTSGVADSSDTALNGNVSSNGSDLKGSTKRVTSTADGKNTSIVEVQYQYTETKEGLKSQNASGQIINEAKLSDSLTFGRFLGASLGDGEAIGTSNIDIDFMGAQAGAYLVGNTKGGLVYDTYFAGSVIENKMSVTTSLMTADSKYYSSMLTTGASITGTLQVKKVEIRPTFSTDLSYMFRETADFDVKVGSATSVE